MLIRLIALTIFLTACVSERQKPEAPSRDVASENVSAGSLVPFVASVPDPAPQPVNNRLRPFTSDGCSRFFDGVPGYDSRLWVTCCIQHDVAYWQGGTEDERRSADNQLRRCVADKAGATVGELMYLGVRLGGSNALPTSWHWGYGWTTPRPYAPLTEGEKSQVALMSEAIPTDLSQQITRAEPLVKTRESVTGDYCVDLAVEHIQRTENRPFELGHMAESVTEFKFSATKVLEVRTAWCELPYRFTFKLLDRNGCVPGRNELTARAIVRLMKIEPPPFCSAP